MSDVTKILGRIDAGECLALQELLPLVYDELRQLAAQRMRRERCASAPRLPHTFMNPD